jgi:parvulin-like peptidyl-prolyl isomerase
MNRSILAVVLVPALALAACKSKNDIVATYDGGKITRGEFYDWMDMKRLSRDAILKSPRQQKNKLEMMAFERFAVEEAKKEGFDKNSDYLAFADMAAESQLMEMLYNREIKEKTAFREPAVRVSQIFIRTKDYKISGGKRERLSEPEMKKESEVAIARAGEIIARLAKGVKFEDLARQYSDDFSKKNGGDIGYIVAEMMPPEFTAAAFALGKGEYTKKPVVTPAGVYVLKVTEKKELKSNNIDKIVKDKMQATRLKNRFYSRASREYLDALASSSDVERHLEKAAGGKPAEVLFRLGDRVVTVADLDRRISLYTGRRPHGTAVPSNAEFRKNVAENFFKTELLRRDAIRKGLDKDPEYIRKSAQRRDSILAREYVRHKGAVASPVTEREMIEEYEAHKNERYYRMADKGGRKEKVVEPYHKVRERIRKVLESRKQSDAVRVWREGLLAARHFAVVESKLEGEREK